jgi:hypothetical protein
MTLTTWGKEKVPIQHIRWSMLVDFLFVDLKVMLREEGGRAITHLR